MDFISGLSKVSEPFVFHREYENDLGKVNPQSYKIKDQCIRGAKITLPFIALYKPIEKPLFIALGTVRVISCTSYLLEVLKSEETSKKYALFKTVFSIVSITAGVISLPCGMLLTTGQDLIINAYQLIEALKAEKYTEAFEISTRILNNSLHLALFFTGALEIIAAALSVQILLGLYLASREFRNGNYLEGCAHLLMTGIRTQQLNMKIGSIKMQWEMKALFGKIDLVDVLMKYGSPNSPALLNAARCRDLEAVECLLNSGFDVNVTDGVDTSTPFSLAITSHDLKLAELLLSRGADINKGFALIMSIAQLTANHKYQPGIENNFNKIIEIIKFLLEKGANPNITNPLMKVNALKLSFKIQATFPAIVEAKKQVINLLLKYGAKE